MSSLPDPAAAFQALDASGDGVAIFASDWTITYINPMGAAVLDRRVEELVGRNMWEAFPEAVGTVFHTSLLQAAAGEEPVVWQAYYGPVHGWFEDRAMRCGDEVVVLYRRVDEPRAAEAERQRLSASVQEALRRTELLLRASEAVAGARSVQEIAESVSSLIRGALAPAFVGLDLLDGAHGRLHRVSVQPLRSPGGRPVPAPVRARWTDVDAAVDLPAAVSIRSRKAVFCENRDQVAAAFPPLAEDVELLGWQAFACVPLTGPRGVLGVLLIAWSEPHPMDPMDRAVITTLAGYTAQALHGALAVQEQVETSEQRYQAAHDLVLTMQRNLLPNGVPVLPSLRLAAQYVVSGRELAAGGDWFDAVPLEDGRVALLVGDVVGHGAVAAAAMGQLRAIAVQALRSGADAAATLDRLDGFAADEPAALGATASLVVLDPRTGALEHVTRAHPPPLVLERGGRTRFLAGGPTATLGNTGAPPEVRIDRMRPGELLLLYSDGLIERPGRTLSEGLTALAEVASSVAAAHPDVEGAPPLADHLSSRVVARFLSPGYADDVTVLAAELLPEPRPGLQLDLAPRPAALSACRRAIRAWLAQLDATDDDATVLLHAAGEAISNVVEHAYAAESERTDGFTIRGDLDRTGTARVVVRDRGRWRRPTVDPAGRGRGLTMMRGLVDAVSVEHTGEGTCVTLRHRLRRPATIGAATAPRGAPEADPEWAAVLRLGEHPVLTVSGPIDLTSADDLRLRILEASRGGGLALTLDLAGVTHLSSVGVRMLHDLVTAGDGLQLDVRAPRGGVAYQVLALTGLDHLVVDANQRGVDSPGAVF